MTALVIKTRKGIFVFFRNEGGETDACEGYANNATKMNCIRVINNPVEVVSFESIKCDELIRNTAAGLMSVCKSVKWDPHTGSMSYFKMASNA
jgi:hypothetical protein